MVLLTLLFNICYNSSGVGANIWLAKWNTVEGEEAGNMSFSTLVKFSYYIIFFALREYNIFVSGEYIGVMQEAQIIFVVMATFSLATGAIFASKLIHNQLLVNILRLPMSFFDTTPSGRILNRFSKDINTIDETIPRSIRSFINTFFTVLSTNFVISYAIYTTVYDCDSSINSTIYSYG